jgi:hypothetical protein
MYFTKLKNKTLVPCEDQHFIFLISPPFSHLSKGTILLLGKQTKKNKKKVSKKNHKIEKKIAAKNK